MKLVLDTNAYSLGDAKNPNVLDRLVEATSYFLPSVVYGELYYGFKHGSKFHENLKRLDQFIKIFNVEVISIDTQIAIRFGEIYSSLRKKGKRIPTNDIWIAACCMEVGGTLLTADRHFEAIEQIQVSFI